jgi:hypothetical protein
VAAGELVVPVPEAGRALLERLPAHVRAALAEVLKGGD